MTEKQEARLSPIGGCCPIGGCPIGGCPIGGCCPIATVGGALNLERWSPIVVPNGSPRSVK
jgi:hypothetical protein